jgi:hypothetical protein
VSLIISIPNSNTLYEKYELELFVIVSYDKAIKKERHQASTQSFFAEETAC